MSKTEDKLNLLLDITVSEVPMSQLRQGLLVVIFLFLPLISLALSTLLLETAAENGISSADFLLTLCHQKKLKNP